MEVATPRLLMRPWRADDRAPFFAINSDPRVVRFLNPLTREGSDAMLDRIDAHFERHGWGSWALEERASGQLVGLCGLSHFDADVFFAPAVEIGWRLAAGWQGKGLAREAAEAALDAGFGALGLDRVVSFTTPEDSASWGLMQRLGMRQVGEFDYPGLPEGHPLRRHLLYEISVSDWRPPPTGNA